MNKEFREYVLGGAFTLNLRKTHIDAIDRIAHKNFLLHENTRFTDYFIQAFRGLERRGLCTYDPMLKMKCQFPYELTKAGAIKPIEKELI